MLELFLEDPTRELFGFQIREATGLGDTTVNPMLWRLKRAGWLTSTLTDTGPNRGAGPRFCHHYRLTECGEKEAEKVLRRNRSAMDRITAAKLLRRFVAGIVQFDVCDGNAAVVKVTMNPVYLSPAEYDLLSGWRRLHYDDVS